MKTINTNKTEISKITKCPDYLTTKFFLNKPVDCIKRYV